MSRAQLTSTVEQNSAGAAATPQTDFSWSMTAQDIGTLLNAAKA